jgi:osmotically-inducible protein OsmY
MKAFRLILGLVCLALPFTVLASNEERIVHEILDTVKARGIRPKELYVKAGGGVDPIVGAAQGDLPKGVVRLEGKVGHPTDRDKIEQVAMSVNGVERVINDIQIDPAGAHSPWSRSQSNLARDITEVLRNSDIGDSRVTILSDGGNITITGTTANQQSRQKIVSLVKAQNGVTNIEDRLQIQSPPSDQQLSDLLRLSLQKANVDTERFTFRVQEGVVALRGDAKDHYEVDQILSATLMTPGLRDVKSEITIRGAPYMTHAYELKK